MGEIAEVVIAGDARTSFGCSEVGGVAMNVQHHVACVISDRGIRMGGAVVEELGQSLHGRCGAVGLLGGERADGWQHGGVDGAGIEEERSQDFL